MSASRIHPETVPLPQLRGFTQGFLLRLAAILGGWLSEEIPVQKRGRPDLRADPDLALHPDLLQFLKALDTSERSLAMASIYAQEHLSEALVDRLIQVESELLAVVDEVHRELGE